MEEGSQNTASPKHCYYPIFLVLGLGTGWDRVYDSLSGKKLCLRLASNLLQFFCLCLQNAGIRDIYQHTHPGILCSKLTNLPPICGGCPLTLTCTNKSPYIFYISDSKLLIFLVLSVYCCLELFLWCWVYAQGLWHAEYMLCLKSTYSFYAWLVL